jgi:hypothetical protein
LGEFKPAHALLPTGRRQLVSGIERVFFLVNSLERWFERLAQVIDRANSRAKMLPILE